MSSSQDALREEQRALDDLYSKAEALARQLDGPVQAATSVSAKAAQEARLARLDQLQTEIEDTARLIAIGRVDFGGGTHAGRSVYIGRTLIGDPDEDYPPMSSWKADVAGAFYNPLGFEGGDVVERKRSLIGRDRTVHDIIEERPLELRERLAQARTAAVEQPPETKPAEEPEAQKPVPTLNMRETIVSPPLAEQPIERSIERPTINVAPPGPPPAQPTDVPAVAPAATGSPTELGLGGGGELVDPLIRRLRDRQGTQLAPIIETIQARQYELMERPLDRTLVIQGGPGTGKTVIALHRIAVQLYRSRGELAQSDILFVGPSRTFVRYVDKVLPSLGDHNVVHRAIQDLARHGAVAIGHDPADVAFVKGLPQMAEVIDRFLRGRARIDRRDIRLGRGELKAVAPDALQPILEQAKQSAKNYGELRARFRSLLSAEENLRAIVPSASSGERIALDSALADAFAEDTVPTLSPRAVIHELLTSPVLMEAAADGLLSAAQQATIRRRAATVGQHPWTNEDFPLLDEAAEQLGSERRPRRYAHVVIDEAQDFSAMQLRMLRRRAGGGITVLGDLAQASTGWTPATWDEHLGSGGIELDDLEELAESYRTTRPILEAANRLLIVIDLGLEPPRAVIPDGAPVRAVELGVPADDAHAVASLVEELTSAIRPDESIGIIGPQATLDRIRPELFEAGLDVWDVEEEVTGAVVLVPVDDAKGLEFDHVILLEPERIHRTNAATGPRKLYVAMTRARTSLTLLNRDRLPRVLDELPAIVRLPAIPRPPAAVEENAPEASEPDAPHDEELPIDTDSVEEESVAPPAIPVRLQKRLQPQKDASRPEHQDDPRPSGPFTVTTGRGEIVLTDHPGIDRRDLIEHAERLGFAVRPDVTATTTLVVVGRTSSVSRRARLARDLRVPLATAEALLGTLPGGEIDGEIQDPR